MSIATLLSQHQKVYAVDIVPAKVDMPLFFFLSGITMKINRGGMKGYVIKLLRSILVPYFLYSFLYFGYNILQNIILHKSINLLAGFLGIFVQLRGTEYSLGLWFLPLLFISEILVYIIIGKKNYIQS